MRETGFLSECERNHVRERKKERESIVRRIYDGINLNRVTSGKNYRSLASPGRRLRGRRTIALNRTMLISPSAPTLFIVYIETGIGPRSRISLVGSRKSARSLAERADKRSGNVAPCVISFGTSEQNGIYLLDIFSVCHF